MAQSIALNGTSDKDVTRFMDETGAIYVAQHDIANTCKGCAFQFGSQKCLDVPAYCGFRRYDGQPVIWIKESS